jgi:hypothetical protein
MKEKRAKGKPNILYQKKYKLTKNVIDNSRRF